MNIVSINTRPEYDPHNAAATKTILEYDPRTDSLIVDQEYDTNSTTADRHFGLVLTCRIPGYPLEYVLEEWIKNNESKFAEVRDGYEVAWNGNNYVGKMSDDGYVAWCRICDALNNNIAFSDECWQWWTVSDWCRGVEKEIGPNTTDAELAEIAALWEPINESVVIIGSVYDYLVELRDYLRYVEDENTEI